MHISEQRIKIDSNWFSAEREVRRSKGLHLSHVLNFIEEAEGKEHREGGLSDIGHAYAACGFLWERVLERVVELDPTELFEWLFTRAMVDVPNPRVIRPGEMCVDGIYLTPDGYDIEDQVLEEWKFTTKSFKGGITGPKFKRWIKYQIPAYLHALNLTTCRLRVCFARGDYGTTSIEPVWMEYLIEYSQQEIEETWMMIVNNAQAMIDNDLVNPEGT